MFKSLTEAKSVPLGKHCINGKMVDVKRYHNGDVNVSLLDFELFRNLFFRNTRTKVPLHHSLVRFVCLRAKKLVDMFSTHVDMAHVILVHVN